MPTLQLQCHCGNVKGQVRDVNLRGRTRTICHCNDCQAYARHLPDTDSILDKFGGSDIVQLTPAQVTIDLGMDQLRCLRLTRKGLYRWYADCCKTPIANTVSPGFPFVGLMHTALKVNGPMDACLGPVDFYIQGKSAKAQRTDQKVHAGFPISWFLFSAPWMIWGKLRGKHKPSPFFDATGKPPVKPEILQS